MLETFLQFLAEQRVAQTSAQMVTFDDRRGLELLERYGFRVLNRSRITKFAKFTNQSVYLTTIFRDVPRNQERIIQPIWKRDVGGRSDGWQRTVDKWAPGNERSN
jgi:hypothetical protein